MSVENLKLNKKSGLIPIDPPLEFQDSPQSTLVSPNILEDFASHLSTNLILNAIPKFSTQHLNLVNKQKHHHHHHHHHHHQHNSQIVSSTNTRNTGEECLLNNQHIYANDSSSVSLINNKTTNFKKKTDNAAIKNSCRNDIKKSTNSIQLETDCKEEEEEEEEDRNYNRDINIFQKFSPLVHSEIHDYDLYYGIKKNYYNDPHHHHHYHQRKIIYSPLHHNGGNLCTTNRPHSRNSLNSRLSSSHNSLSVSNSNKPDDSIFITQAMSHDALSSKEISDFYNVPADSDIYASPIDMIRPDNQFYCQRDITNNKKFRLKYLRCKKSNNSNNNKRYNFDTNDIDSVSKFNKQDDKRNHGSSKTSSSMEPIQLTLEEVKQFYHTMYSNTKELKRKSTTTLLIDNHKMKNITNTTTTNTTKADKSTTIIDLTTKQPIAIQSTKIKSLTTSRKKLNNNNNQNNIINNNNNNKKKDNETININNNNTMTIQTTGKRPQFSMNLNLKQKFCNIFRFGKPQKFKNLTESTEYISPRQENTEKIQFRALPPLPTKADGSKSTEEEEEVAGTEKKKTELNSSLHFASSIEKVKDYGWYWGPLSSDAADKVLSNEPDGSFIVRDSSDDHYIFSLSFKLNNCVRHVRIEQDQGTFSFGSYAKFKSQTITEFIEKAVEHSRSGRYLFFLHRRPEHGPMRVQLTNPVSRFKHVQSLQHTCRFIILKLVVRKDLVQSLPLPRRLLDYLSYKHCYSEQVDSDSSQSQHSIDNGF